MTEPQLLTRAEAAAQFKVSLATFDRTIRQQLTVKRPTKRTVRFLASQVAAMLEEDTSEEEEMLRRRKVGDALDHAWEVRWRHARGAHKKKSLYKTVKKEIGNEPLRSFDFNRIEEWVSQMRGNDLSTATIKSKLSALSVALRYAKQKKWISETPEFPEMEKTSHRLRYLLDDPDEEAMLIKACGCLAYKDCDVMRLLIVVLVDTGCRLSEVMKVRDRHIQHGRVILEKRKADDDHSVKLTSRAEKALIELLRNKRWRTRTRGAGRSAARRRTCQNWLTHAFAEVRDDAGLRDVTLHTLRHTCASRLIQGGADIYQVKDILGHSTVTVTERYAHLAPQQSDRVIDILENRGKKGKNVVPFEGRKK